MKKVHWVLAFTFFCLVPLRGQIVQNYPVMLSVVDSLLLHCDTTALSHIIQSDLTGNKDISSSDQSSWDNVKSAYVSVLTDIDRTLTQSIEGKKNAITEAKEMDNRYRKQDVGEKAFSAYEKFKEENLKDNIDGALTFLVVAHYFRNSYINQVKKQLSLNADSIKIFLDKAEIELNIAQQDRAMGKGFGNLDKANELIDIYTTQDQQSPAYRSLSRDIVNQYEDFGRKLKKLQEGSRLEQESDYREQGFIFGGSFGGLYAISEPYPLCTAVAWPNETYIYRYANEAIFTYSISANISYYVKQNLSCEFMYKYANGYFQPPKFPFKAGERYSFFPKQNRTVIFSSISYLTNYYFRIKTGLRPLVGLGLSYSSTLVSQVAIQHQGFISCISDAQHRNSLRVIARSGLEYIPSAASFLSYSIMMDFSVNLKSDQEVSLFILEPSLRISWLI